MSKRGPSLRELATRLPSHRAPTSRAPALEAARAALAAHHPGAVGAFVAGSAIDGTATEHSDLDIVVIYEALPNAYQHSLRFQGWPVDFVVQDPDTLGFFFERERQIGVPTLPTMVAEGTPLGDPPILAELQDGARAILAAGPAPLPDALRDQARYQITALRDDLRDPRPASERAAIAVALHEPLVTLYLRSRGRWAALGKRVPRALQAADPGFAERFSAGFAEAVAGDPAAWIAVCDEVLAGVGGPLSDGYRTNAPRQWRM
ncbi:MAG: nucleotidyltransferase domain-containing protein [Myxococcota bacterium]